MYSQDELVGLYDFLKNTGEGNLKKMLVGPKFTDAHFRVLMKAVRGCKDSEFADHLLNNTLPKIKLNGPELALKETFWGAACEAFSALGLLNKKAAA